MSSRCILKLPFILVLVISLLVNPASMLSYVWCVGADGDHAALEFVPAGDCSLDDCAPSTPGVATTALDAPGEKCGPCLDVSFSCQGSLSRSHEDAKPGKIPAEILPVGAAVAKLLPSQLPSTNRFLDPPPYASDYIFLHRTTVLLI